VVQLRDSNLKKAYNELADFRRAIGVLQLGNVGTAPDHVAEILGWIDWDQYKPWDSANQIGRADWPASAIGELKTVLTDLPRQCHELAQVWQGAAADAFQEFAKNVSDNIGDVVEKLEATVKIMSSGDGSVHQAMMDLTRNVWKTAGEIADDPKVRKAISDIVNVSKDEQDRKDAQLELLGGIERLKQSVIKQVDRIDEDVLSLLRPVTDSISLKDPLPSATRPPGKTRMADASIATAKRDQILSSIAGIRRSSKKLHQAWHAISTYDFGTSANAQEVVKAWRQAIASRSDEVHKCYRWGKAMYAGVTAAMFKYYESENENHRQMVNVAWELDMLSHYSRSSWYVGPETGSVSVPENRNITGLDAEMISERLGALDAGWNGKEDLMAFKRRQELQWKGEGLDETGVNLGEKIGRGIPRGGTGGK
jgi:uncharacterized protein YukE